MRFAAPVTSAQRPSRVGCLFGTGHHRSSVRVFCRQGYTIDTPMILPTTSAELPVPSDDALRHERRARRARFAARSSAPAAGSISRATWSSRCTRRASAITAPAARSSARPAISSRRRSSSRSFAPRARADARRRARGARVARRRWSSAPAAVRSRANLLDTFARLGRDVRYRILEPSADLRERQQRALARFADRVQWLERLPEAPFSGVVVANEVLDALPVSRVRDRAGEPQRPRRRRERTTASTGQRGRASPELARPCARSSDALGAPLPNGYRSRSSASRCRLGSRALAASLERGSLLFVDYGLVRTRLLPRAARRRHVDLPLPPSRPRRSVRSIRGCKTSRRGWTSAPAPKPRRRPASPSPVSRRKGNISLNVLAALPPALAVDLASPQSRAL